MAKYFDCRLLWYCIEEYKLSYLCYMLEIRLRLICLRCSCRQLIEIHHLLICVQLLLYESLGRRKKYCFFDEIFLSYLKITMPLALKDLHHNVMNLYQTSWYQERENSSYFLYVLIAWDLKLQQSQTYLDQVSCHDQLQHMIRYFFSYLQNGFYSVFLQVLGLVELLASNLSSLLYYYFQKVC